VGERNLLDRSKKVTPQAATRLRKQSSAIGRLEDHITCGSTASEISCKIKRFLVKSNSCATIPLVHEKNLLRAIIIFRIFSTFWGKKRKKRVPTIAQRSKQIIHSFLNDSSYTIMQERAGRIELF
jgi:hypothetical protein